MSELTWKNYECSLFTFYLSHNKLFRIIVCIYDLMYYFYIFFEKVIRNIYINEGKRKNFIWDYCNVFFAEFIFVA